MLKFSSFNSNIFRGTRTLDDISQLSSDETRFGKIHPDEPCNIQFTSGTTGTPKAALLSHFNFVNNGIRAANRSKYNEKPHRICIQVPFFHAFGLVITMTAAITHGATIVIPAPNFDAEKSLRAIVDEK